MICIKWWSAMSAEWHNLQNENKTTWKVSLSFSNKMQMMLITKSKLVHQLKLTIQAQSYTRLCRATDAQRLVYKLYYFHLEVRSKKIISGTSLKRDAWYSSTCKIGTFSSVWEIIYEAADRITESVRALIYLLSSPNFEMGPFRDSVSPK